MYAEPLEVLDQLDQVENRSESFNNVKKGEVLELDETYLIESAFDVGGSAQDILVTADGTTASTSDYEVDLRDGRVTWNGTGGADLKIRYKTGPVPNSTVKSEIKAATERVDDETNTTFGGLKTVTETYDVDEENFESLVLFNRPVRSIQEVRVNEAAEGDSDNFKTLTAGRSNDYYRDGTTSVNFVTGSRPYRGRDKVEVTYDYGYSNVPEQINKLVRMMAAQALFQNNTMGEGIGGRDDFNPRIQGDFINSKKEILDSWKVRRFNEQVPSNL